MAGEPFESDRNNIPDHLANKNDETMNLDLDDGKSHLSFMSNENDMPEITESRIEEKANTGGDMRADPNAMAAALAA